MSTYAQIYRRTDVYTYTRVYIVKCLPQEFWEKSSQEMLSKFQTSVQEALENQKSSVDSYIKEKVKVSSYRFNTQYFAPWSILRRDYGSILSCAGHIGVIIGPSEPLKMLFIDFIDVWLLCSYAPMALVL